MKAILLVIAVLMFSTLVIAQNLDVNIYTEKADGTRDYTAIDAKPGETISAFIEVLNENSDRTDDDQDIENIEVTLTIEDIDIGENIEESFDDFDLRPKKTKSLPFSFKVPYEVEDKNYDIFVDIEASEGSTNFDKTFDFLVSIDKDPHDLKILDLAFNPPKVRCNEVSNLNILIYNLGSSDEEATLSIKNNDLKFSVERKVELESYPGDIIYQNTIPIKVPLDAKSTTYSFELTLAYSGLTINKVLNLEVTCDIDTIDTIKERSEEKIEEPKADQQETKTAVTAPKTTQQDTTAQNTQIIVQQKSNFPLLLLIILAILILLAIILILALKKR